VSSPGRSLAPVPILQEAGSAPGTVWTGAENLAPTGIRSPDRPARSQSLILQSLCVDDCLVCRASLRASGNYVPIIRRNNCINMTPGIFHSVWTTVWHAGHHYVFRHPHRVTNTRCRTDTVISSDDGHIVARNM
jgi:hypothetical protein